ncbi:MAG: cytochrome c biogenesis protein CcdA, partial [Bacteroidota bacterium]
MKRFFSTFFLIALFSFIIVYAAPEGAKYIKTSAKPSKQKVSEGEKFTIQLTVNFSGEWYTYSLKKQENSEGLGPERTEIKIGSSNLLKINGKIQPSKPHIKDDPAYEMKVEYYKPTAEFEIPVTAKKAIDFSKDKIVIIARMQICNKTTCLPSEDYKVIVSKETYQATIVENSTQEKVEETKTVSAESATTTATIKQAERNNKANESTAKGKDSENKTGFLSMLLLAMAAGAAALLTPCVFPMVPITVSFFTKRFEQQKGSGKGLRDATVYALGIIVSFTLLGFIFSLLFGAAGVQNLTSNPWVAMFIAFIFLFFGLSLFGAYEIQLPTSLINKLNAKSQSSTGIASVILMAITFSLASFSCTGPLVGAALVGAAQGDWFYPIVSMVGFSTVLAFPFFFLALFPTAMNKMPRAGGWMNNIKGVLGFIVLAASLK